MRTNTALIRAVFTGILVAAGYVLDPVGTRQGDVLSGTFFGLPTSIASALVALLRCASSGLR
jgi:hypothetical protein